MDKGISRSIYYFSIKYLIFISFYIDWCSYCVGVMSTYGTYIADPAAASLDTSDILYD